MIKVLVVEDDKLARKGLIHAMPWNEFDMKVTGEASNGKSALEFLESHDVDLMVTDLAMPVMSGIELLRMARERHPELLCVVLTLHQELEYAQEAIRLGVIDYVAKVQLEKEQFDAVLARIRARFLQERKKIESSRTGTDAVECFTSDVAYALLSVEENPESAWISRCIAVSDRRLHEIEAGAWLWEPCEGPGCESELAAITRSVEALVGWMLIRLTGLMGEHKNRIHSLVRKYRKTGLFFQYDRHAALVTKRMDDLDVPSPAVEEAELDGIKEQWLAFGWIYNDELFGLLRDQLKAVRPGVNRLFRFLGELENEWNRVFWAVTSYRMRVPETLSSWQEVESWMAEVRKSAVAGIKKMSYRREVITCVMEAVRIVDKEAKAPVFAVDVARRVNMSRGYFCQCFKDITGRSFNDFLRFTRMEKAKLLLLHTETQIYHIAEQVGYTDEKYFSRVFRSEIGMLPSEFRQRHGEGGHSS
jgi:two-component system response regulator YesN